MNGKKKLINNPHSDMLGVNNILDFRMDDLAHHGMTRLSSDIKRRRLNMTLFRKCPFVVLFSEFRNGVLVFRSG